MTDIKAQWELVSDLWSQGSDECAGCPHCHTWSERHPYGSTVAVEEFGECDLGNRASDKPTDCSAFVCRVEEVAQ